MLRVCFVRIFPAGPALRGGVQQNPVHIAGRFFLDNFCQSAILYYEAVSRCGQQTVRIGRLPRQVSTTKFYLQEE